MMNFTSNPSQVADVDVPVWNMNIVNLIDIAGLDLTIHKDRDLSIGKNYEGTAINYGYLSNIYVNVNPNTVITGSTSATLQATGYTQTINKVGIIHYTNNTIENYYGEGFYSNTLTLTIPYLMWHKQQFGGVTMGNTIGYTFVCDSTLKQINGLVPYYDLIDQETFPTVVGKVLVEEKIILIENPELITALSYKANRNWTLPTPNIQLVDVGHCNGANLGGALQPNEQVHITYLLTNSTNTCGIQCEDYQTVINYFNIPKDVLFQFPKDPSDPTYTEFSYLMDYGNEMGLGFSADNIYLLWQKTEIGGVPDPIEWRKYNMNSYIGTNGCLAVGIPTQQLYFRKDTIYLPKSTVNTTTTYQPIGDVLVFMSSIASTGSLLKQASSEANVGVDGDYWQYPLTVTGSTNGTPIFKINPTFNSSGYFIELGYLYGTITNASTITQSVTMPPSLSGYTYLDEIYLNGSGNVCLTLNNQPNNNTVYLFKNGTLVSDNNYGVFTTGTTANRRVELTTFTPLPGDVLTLYYLDNSSSSTLGTAPMTASNINNLLVYINKTILDNSVTNYYNLGDVITLPPPSNPTGLTFGDEVFFYGNVKTDIQSTTYKTIFTFNVLPNTFITSQNPTFDVNRNKVAFTEVGIYDSNDDLVAIGKFSQPITRKYNSDIISLQATIDF
jgi:hypothetical protein